MHLKLTDKIKGLNIDQTLILHMDTVQVAISYVDYFDQCSVERMLTTVSVKQCNYFALFL